MVFNRHCFTISVACDIYRLLLRATLRIRKLNLSKLTDLLTLSATQNDRCDGMENGRYINNSFDGMHRVGAYNSHGCALFTQSTNTTHVSTSCGIVSKQFTLLFRIACAILCRQQNIVPCISIKLCVLDTLKTALKDTCTNITRYMLTVPRV